MRLASIISCDLLFKLSTIIFVFHVITHRTRRPYGKLAWPTTATIRDLYPTNEQDGIWSKLKLKDVYDLVSTTQKQESVNIREGARVTWFCWLELVNEERTMQVLNHVWDS